MKIPPDEKLNRILDVAATQFASQPFHKVLLSDVALAANVGKGTLYLYFKSKEELYLSVLFRGFSRLVTRLRETITTDCGDPVEQLTCIIREHVSMLYADSTITELLRGAVVGCPHQGKWAEKRLELRSLIEGVIRAGVAQGVFVDEHPELTAQYIPGIIRSVALFRPEHASVDTVQKHVLDFVLKSLNVRNVEKEER